MVDSPSIAVKSQFTGDLELIARCPVCLGIPSGPVSMCARGHHLCRPCRSRVSRCPVCNGRRFSRARNFVAEELGSNITSTLVRGLSIQTDPQTQGDTENSDCLLWCRIGSCEFGSPAECIYFHAIELHKENFAEKKLTGMLYKRWRVHLDVPDLEYTPGEGLDKCFVIENMGLFFLNVQVDALKQVLVKLEVASSLSHKAFYHSMHLTVSGQEFDFNNRRGGWVERCSSRSRKLCNAHIFDKTLFSKYCVEKGLFCEPEKLSFELDIFVRL